MFTIGSPCILKDVFISIGCPVIFPNLLSNFQYFILLFLVTTCGLAVPSTCTEELNFFYKIFLQEELKSYMGYQDNH